MADYIAGCDISHAQGQIDWSTFKNNVNFVFIQSSYGVGNFDSEYGNNKGQVLQTTLPHGYYHFAYPNLNSPLDEAKWFVTALSAIKPLQKGELVILDYEMQSSAIDNVAWVKTFMDYVSSHFGGLKLILYTYQSMLTENDFSSIANEGYGLWIAAPTNDPNNNNFQTGAFKFAMAQQWGTETIPGVNGPVDADIFFGTAQQLLDYGYQPQQASPAQPVVNSQPQAVANDPSGQVEPDPQQTLASESTPPSDTVQNNTQEQTTSPNEPSQPSVQVLSEGLDLLREQVATLKQNHDALNQLVQTISSQLQSILKLVHFAGSDTQPANEPQTGLLSQVKKLLSKSQ